MHIVIAHFHDPLQARIVLGRLQAEGLQATLDDEHTLLANWEWRLAVGGARLRVPEAQAARARAVLVAIDGGGFALGGEEEGASSPHEEDEGDRESPSSRLAWLALMLFGLPLPWRRRHRHADRRAV